MYSPMKQPFVCVVFVSVSCFLQSTGHEKKCSGHVPGHSPQVKVLLVGGRLALHLFWNIFSLAPWHKWKRVHTLMLCRFLASYCSHPLGKLYSWPPAPNVCSEAEVKQKIVRQEQKADLHVRRLPCHFRGAWYALKLASCLYAVGVVGCGSHHLAAVQWTLKAALIIGCCPSACIKWPVLCLAQASSSAAAFLFFLSVS